MKKNNQNTLGNLVGVFVDITIAAALLNVSIKTILLNNIRSELDTDMVNSFEPGKKKFIFKYYLVLRENTSKSQKECLHESIVEYEKLSLQEKVALEL